MGEDEAGTLEKFTDLRSGTIEPAIAARGGRVFKSMGDALLVEFTSAVDATECAMELADKTAASSPDALSFRFGIHVGDVIDEGGDLFGDAVNIAARLEAEAAPGSIVLSEDAARYVNGKIGAEIHEIGERRLKNIAAPVILFRIGGAEDPEQEESPAIDRIGRTATVAVGDFRHLGDPAQAFVTEGLVEGLGIALALFDAFDLVEWQTGEPDPPNYLLEGSVQATADRARITVRFTELSTRRSVWGTTYDRSLEDPFTVQDDLIATIACTIGEAIPEEVALALSEKREEDYTANDWIWDGLHKFHRIDPEGCRLGQQALVRALEIAPDLPEARLILGWTYTIQGMNGWPSDQDDPLGFALQIARDLVRENERFASAWRLLGRISINLGQTEEGLAHVRRALEINPYDSDIVISCGMCLVRSGNAAEGLPMIERANRINPYAPAYYKSELALAHLVAGDPAAALTALQDLSRPVGHSRLTHAVALVGLNRIEEARALVRDHLAELPGTTVANGSQLAPGTHADRYSDALVRAGLPRE